MWGQVYGKESHNPSSDACRAILPLSAMHTIVDSLLSAKILAELPRILPVPEGCYLGGRPGTQCLDIAFDCQMVIEAGLDMHSKSAVCQADLRRYYDSLPTLHIAMFLIQLGVCPMLVAACVVAQMCPDIHLAFLDSTCKISQRTLGALTGSRLAGVFGFV